MIAYSKEGLQRNWIIHEALHAQNTGTLNANEVAQLRSAYPSVFYCPNIFTRIALFILTYMASSAAMGVLMILSTGLGSTQIAGFLYLLLGGFCLFTAEFFINKYQHYKSGVDTSLLWTTVMFLAVGLNMLLELSFNANALIIMAIGTGISIRYVNHAMIVTVILALFALLYNILEQAGEGTRAAMPFLFMAMALVIIIVSEKMKRRHLLRFHYNSFLVAQVTGMTILFISGNYFVVSEVEKTFFPAGLPPLITSTRWLFWTLTFFIPSGFIFYGIYKREVPYLRVGLGLLPFLFLTYWHYYQPIRLEWVITLKGAGLILIVYVLIRYLHNSRKGITSRKISDKKTLGVEEVEALIASGVAPNGSDSPMGGGSGGGAGATGDF